MLFNSLTFPVFLALVLTGYWMLPGRRSRVLWLLGSSYVFYGWWDWRFLGLILASSLIDFVAGLRVGTGSAGRRRAWLAMSLVTNLGILGTFKYLDFFAGSAAWALQQAGFTPNWTTLNLVLPVGISFYTFQSMSYTIDVYRGRLTPCRELPAFLLYVGFFPQLVAGPIERAGDLLPQLRDGRRFDPALARRGLRYILWGFVLKSVLADNLAPVVNAVFATPEGGSRAEVWQGFYLFAFQIYGDFAGYTYIAIGVAALFGVRLSANFRRPYLATSIREFWTRWHITLSRWFRDYVYIAALGGSRAGRGQWVRNILLTFTLSGLWHGASWTMVAWGLFHGLAYFLPPLGRTERSVTRLFNTLLTFHLVCLGWLLFRATDLAQAGAMLRTAVVGHPASSSQPQWHTALLAGCAVVVGVELIQRKRDDTVDLDHLPTWARWLIYYLLVVSVVMLGRFDRQPFVYFQF